MKEKSGKGGIRSLGLGLLLGSLVLVSAGQSWAMMIATSHAEITLPVTITGLTFTEDLTTYDASPIPNVSDSGGYATSLATADTTLLSVNADVGASSGNLYQASASSFKRVDFTVTGLGPGSIILSILGTDFSVTSSVPDPPYTTASSYAYLEIWNTTTWLSDIVYLSNGTSSQVTQMFNTGDSGYYVLGVTADATASVPEPSSFLLLGAGLAGLALLRRKKTA